MKRGIAKEVNPRNPERKGQSALDPVYLQEIQKGNVRWSVCEGRLGRPAGDAAPQKEKEPSRCPSESVAPVSGGKGNLPNLRYPKERTDVTLK